MDNNPYSNYQVTLLEVRVDLLAALGRCQALDRRDRERARSLIDDLQRARLRIDAEFETPRIGLVKV